MQAFTHPSFTILEYSDQHNFISSYQRLEFIGDAILDYLITYFVYLQNPQMTPFQITQLRSALVNNIFYASIVVKYNLHKYLRQSNPILTKSIIDFSKKYKYQYLKKFDILFNSSFEEQECSSIDEIDVPKALSDIFEALVGAIYIDNGFNLDHLWKIVYRMIKTEVGKLAFVFVYGIFFSIFIIIIFAFSLDYFLKNIPTNPLDWLDKKHVNRYKFGLPTKISELKRKINLTISEVGGENEKTFMGYGQNKRQCKLSAAKRAMTFFSNMNNDGGGED